MSHFDLNLDHVRVCGKCHYPVYPVFPKKGGQPTCPICEGRNLRHLKPESVDGGEEMLSVSLCCECGAPLWNTTTVCQVCFYDPVMDGDDALLEDFGSEVL